MWVIIVKVLTTIVNALMAIYTSPAVRILSGIVGDTVAALPEGFAAQAFALVKSAMNRADMTNEQRFQYVYDELTRQYPDLGGNTIKVVIESALAAVKKGWV